MQHNLKGTFPGDIVDIKFDETNVNSNDWSVKLSSFTVITDGKALTYSFDEDGRIMSIGFQGLGTKVPLGANPPPKE